MEISEACTIVMLIFLFLIVYLIIESNNIKSLSFRECMLLLCVQLQSLKINMEWIAVNTGNNLTGIASQFAMHFLYSWLLYKISFVLQFSFIEVYRILFEIFVFWLNLLIKFEEEDYSLQQDWWNEWQSEWSGDLFHN